MKAINDNRYTMSVIILDRLTDERVFVEELNFIQLKQKNDICECYDWCVVDFWDNLVETYNASQTKLRIKSHRTLSRLQELGKLDFIDIFIKPLTLREDCALTDAEKSLRDKYFTNSLN